MIAVALLAIGVTLSLSVVATWIVRRVALRVGFIDRPGGHKAHTRTLALGGGIAIFWAIVIPLLAGTLAARALRDGTVPTWCPDVVRPHLDGISMRLPTVLAILGGALVLHVLGLIDDRKALGPWLKLVVQIGVAVVIAGPVGIRAIEALPVPLSIAVTVLWIVAITNAFNFLDNMDGLSAGVAAIAALIFALASARGGQVFVPTMAWIMVGALAGFLFFNFSPATIIMGDAGSLVVGYLLSVITILTTFYDPSRHLSPAGVFVPILVLAVPLYDIASVVAYRLRLGENPFRADRRHFSHRLVKAGMSPRGAVLTIYLATAATGLPAIVLPLVDWVSASLLAAQCLCVVAMIAVLEHRGGGKGREEST